MAITAAYDVVYKWLDYLNDKDVSIIGYVIMPNYVYVLLHFKMMYKPLNTIIENAKRFLAYKMNHRSGMQWPPGDAVRTIKKGAGYTAGLINAP